MGPQPTAGEEVEVGAGRLQAQLPKVDYQEPASSPCCAQGLEGHQPCDCTELWIGQVDGWAAVWGCHGAGRPGKRQKLRYSLSLRLG